MCVCICIYIYIYIYIHMYMILKSIVVIHKPRRDATRRDTTRHDRTHLGYSTFSELSGTSQNNTTT